MASRVLVSFGWRRRRQSAVSRRRGALRARKPARRVWRPSLRDSGVASYPEPLVGRLLSQLKNSGGPGQEHATGRAPVPPANPRHQRLDRRVDLLPRPALLLRGTFAPFLRASESPIAIACFRLVTLPPLPLLPLLSVPFFLRRIALSTRLLAACPYRGMRASYMHGRPARGGTMGRREAAPEVT